MCRANASRTDEGSGDAPTIGSRSELMSASTGTWARVPYTVGTADIAAIR